MRIIFQIIAGVAAIIAFVGVLLPSSTTVSRSVLIDGESKAIFNILNDYRKFNLWSPWYKRDPKALYEYSGPATGVGSKMSWRSDNPNVGIGSQEITESIPNEKLEVYLTFEGQGDANAFFLLEPENARTKVTWGFTTEHGFNLVSRYFGLMLDKWVGADYEAGLSSLKEVVEGSPISGKS